MNNSSFQDFGLTTISDGAATGLALTKRDIDIGASKKQEFDFQGEVARMLEAAKQQRDGKGTGIKIDEVSSDAKLLTADSLLDPIEKLLRQAHGHIREKHYEKALTVLGQILVEDPNHHEAIYLTAYCQAHSDDGEEAANRAVRTLRPLQDASLESALFIRMQTLYDTLRERRFPPLLAQFFLDKENPGRLIPLLRREVDLDPAWSVPHYLLAGELMVNGNPSEAIAVADRGIQSVRREDHQQLIEIRDAATKRLTEQLLQPVRQLYRQGKFGAAYSAIVKIPSLHRQDRLCTTFEAYLRELSGGATGFWNGLFTKSRTPAEVRPRGTAADVNELGFFLVGSDLDYVRERLINKKRVLQDVIDAEKHCTESIQHAPWFPLIHFVFGECIYVRLIEAIEAKSPAPLEVVERDLRTAKEHLEYAVKDPEITGAPQSLRIVAEALTEVEKTNKARAERAEEVRQLNAAIEEFKDIMDSVKGGVKSSAHQQQVRERLQRLNAELPNLQRVVRSDDCKQVLGQLKSAVTVNLSHLKDAERMERHFVAYNNKMDYLKRNRISNYAQLSAAKTFFNQLLSDARSDRARLQHDESRKALDELISQVKEVINMLNRN